MSIPGPQENHLKQSFPILSFGSQELDPHRPWDLRLYKYIYSLHILNKQDRDTNDTSIEVYHKTQKFVLNMKLIPMKINNGPSHGSILIYFKCFNKKNAYLKCEYLQWNIFAYHYDQKEMTTSQNLKIVLKYFKSCQCMSLLKDFFR